MTKIIPLKVKNLRLSCYTPIIFVTIYLFSFLSKTTWAIDPAFVWKFNQGSGAIAVESQIEHSGTIFGNPQWVERSTSDDPSNKALQFDGIDDYVSIPDHNLINLGGPWSSKTIVIIFKVDNAFTINKQILYEQGGKSRGLNLYVENGNLYAGGWNQDPSQSNWSGEWASTPIESNIWYEAALVLRRSSDIVSSDKLELWLDKELKATVAGAKLYTHNGDIGIGNINQWTEFPNSESNDNKYFQGQIDEIQLYNDVLFAIRIEPTSLIFSETVGMASISSISLPPFPNLDSDYATDEVIIKTVADALIGNPEQSGNTVITASPSLNQLFQQLSVNQMTSVFGASNGFLGHFYHLKFDVDQPLLDIIDNLVAHELIELAQPNYMYRQQLVPNDYDSANQWGLAQISAAAGWNYETGNSNNIVVAIIDSGIDYDHVDLADNIWQNFGETPGNGIDDDNNEYVDDIYGWDFHATPNDNQPDAGEHGTHVAGIVGAVTNNNLGVAGVMWDCKLMAIRVLGDQGSEDAGGYTINIAKGITYAVNNGADVINMSLGADSDDATLKAAIDYAYAQGVVLVAAAGNDNTMSESYPAAYGNVISVGATDSNDSRAIFSNYGNWIDIVAPGVTIFNTTISDGYGNKSGTSMSTPFVSGLAGLILAKNPLLTPNQVANTIRQSADQVEWMTGEFIGRINLESALKYQDNILIFNDSNVALNISNISLDSGNAWLSPSITTASIQAGGSISVGLSIVLDGMSIGTHTDKLTISSSDSLPTDSFVDVSLQLQNNPPTITSLTASTNPLLENQTTNLAVVAHDSDNHTINFNWSVSQGQLSSESGPSVSYTPPDVDQNTTATISVTASDGYGGTDTETLTVSIQSVDVTASPNLAVGFNLLALSVNANTSYTAHSLLNEITNASSVMKWQANSQNWSQAFEVAGNSLGQNFNIQLNQGYLIQIDTPTNWSFVGDPITTATTIQLKVGLNLIGIPYPSNLTGIEVLSTIPNGQTLTCWDAATQSWQSVFKVNSTVLGNDFDLNADNGYFIEVLQETSWIPTASSAAPVKIAPKQIVTLDPINEIKNLTIANLTATSATVVFCTDGVGQSQLKWRSINDKNWKTETRNQMTNIGRNHYLKLSGLQPERIYLVQAEVFDRDGHIKKSQIMRFTTTVVSTGQPKVVFGQVVNSNGELKIDELVVLTASNTKAMISTTDRNGYWYLNLGNMKMLNGDACNIPNEVYFSLLGKGNMYRQEIEGLSVQQLATIDSDSNTTNQAINRIQPEETRINQNYPNPFNPETWIPFQLHQSSPVCIEIYDANGNIIRRLELGQLPAGIYHKKDQAGHWDGLDQTGKRVASGIYFYRLEANGYQESRKMVILK